MAESFNQATTQNPNQHKPIERYLPVVRQQNGIFTELPVVIDNNLTVNGTITGGSTVETVNNFVVASTASLSTVNIRSGVATLNTLVVTSTASLNTTNMVGVNQLVGNNVNWALGGAPAAANTGNNTTMVAGTTYWTQLYLEGAQTLTGSQFLTGATGAADQWQGTLYNASGTPVATSALTSITSLASGNMQSLPFTSTYAAPGPAYYFLGLQSGGTTAKFQSYTVPGMIFGAGSLAGTTSTQPPIAVATLVVYSNNKGPISCVY